MTALDVILPAAPLDEGFLLFGDHTLLPSRLVDLDVCSIRRASLDGRPIEVCASHHFSARWWPAQGQPEQARPESAESV